MGPLAIITHLACGLRMVLLQRQVSPAIAARLVPALMTFGIVISSVILVALFGIRTTWDSLPAASEKRTLGISLGGRHASQRRPRARTDKVA